jgi:hypothetical protein
MRTRKFEVNKGLLAEFFKKVDKAELDTQLLDINRDGDTLLVGVAYESSDRDTITKLDELVEDFNDEGEDDDNEEENDEQ